MAAEEEKEPVREADAHGRQEQQNRTGKEIRHGHAMDEIRKDEKRDKDSNGCFDTGDQLGIAGKLPDAVIEPEEVINHYDKESIEEYYLKVETPV